MEYTFTLELQSTIEELFSGVQSDQTRNYNQYGTDPNNSLNLRIFND